MAKRIKFKIWFVLLVIVGYFVFAWYSSTSVLIATGESYFQSSLSTAVYHAIGEKTIEEINFQNLYEIKYNASGDITFISCDSLKLNVLSHYLATETLEFYNDYCKDGFDVPIGAFSGLKMLSGSGKNVKVKLIQVSSCKCEFVSDFDEAGINQTRQTLYLNIIPDASVVTPFKKTKLIDTISVLIYDNLIVGKVPQTYLTAKTFDGTTFK